MFLESVTLQGFKSFAEKTTLAFEPGITVVVGPNGSGKSNIVDALTWVLGSHSPKTLRGGQMSDVIFAGAPGRSALGRASVEIRIDNSSGVLPIDFTEVTVSRSMYASGDNDYAINGVGCRLLDVAELLSDTGLGRENHTIVGQGRLDAILNARPEERRAFIEEAAGILKHRRRKERALRKLAQMEEHLHRLTDLLAELRRQLRPLERQAEAAAQYAQLRARRDAIALVRALREYDRVSARLSECRLREDELRQAEATHAAEVEQLSARERVLESSLAGAEPRARQAAAVHVRLSTTSERLQGLVGRIDERRAGLVAAVEEPVAGRDPQALRREADDREAALAATVAEVDTARELLVHRGEERAAAEGDRRAHRQAVADEERRAHAALQQRLRREGEISALQSLLSQAAGEHTRLSVQVDALEARRDGLEVDVAHARDEIQRLDAAAPRLAARLAQAERRLVRRTDISDDLATREREYERERASLQARADALRATAERASEGVEAVTAAAATGGLSGVVGHLSAQLRVDEAVAGAVARALGDLGSALVVEDTRRAAEILAFARNRPGSVHLVAGPGEPPPDPGEGHDEVARAGGTPVLRHIDAPEPAHSALSWLLRDVYLVDDLDVAAQLAGRFPSCWFVTRAGESAGARGWSGGVRGEEPAVLAMAGARDAQRRLQAVEEELSVIHRQLSEADRERDGAREEVDAATLLMQESDGQITAAAERLQRLEAELARTVEELDLRRDELSQLSTMIAARRERLAGLEAAHDDAPPSPPAEPAAESTDTTAVRLDDRVTRAREAEVEARVELRSVQDRLEQARARVDELRAEAVTVERQLEQREVRRRRRLAAIDRCDELRTLAAQALDRARRSQAAADAQRTRVDAEQAARREELGAVRERLREQQTAVSEIAGQRHATALRLQELDAAAAGLQEHIAHLRPDEEPDALLATARSARQAGPSDTDLDRDSHDADDTEPAELLAAPLAGGADRDEALATAQARLDRRIARMGDVNPLARIEFERATERHGFLKSQLDDLTASRDDLHEVVRAVDARIEEVFAEAFADVAQAFKGIFGRLFPGGEGQLVLTEPDELLTSGVDVEARPAGKRVKRLSLLSGGERSLTALAVVFAIFAARPSPFYVLDEVEAALDDVNLQRFLDVVTDFRSSSQLILITHQKRTMEVADLLYGVSMQRDGVSRVIGQRAQELVPQR